MLRNYNHIYSRLVEDDSDFIGHIAYSLYKKSKIEYIERQELKGKSLTDMDLVPFNNFTSSDSVIEGYRIKAELTMQGFIDTVLEEELKSYKEQALNEQAEILKNIVKPLIPSFWNNIAIGVVSSFVFAILFVIFALIVEYSNTTISINVEKTQATTQTVK